MKKLLLSLFIILNLIIVPVFADNTVTVFGTETNALNWADYSLGNKFTSVMQEVINYVNTNISDYDYTSDLGILFPNQVLAWDNYNNDYYIIFYFSYRPDGSIPDGDDVKMPYGVISHNPNDVTWWNNESTAPYNLCVGLTSNLGASAFWVTYHNGVISHTSYTVIGSVDKSSLWSITATIDNGKYLIANTKAGFNNKYGLAGSIYLNSPSGEVSYLPCFDNYYAGWDTGNWYRRYILNSNQRVVPWNQYVTGTDVYVTTDVIVSGNTIIFDPNNTDGVDFDINTLDIWGTLKYYIMNLLSGFQIVIYLFMVIFSWLPFEFVTLIYSCLILAVTLLLIKVLRGG